MHNKRRLILSVFYILIGITLLALSIMKILDSTIYAGFGGGMIAVGILQTIRNIRYLKDPEYKNTIDIAENDERYRLIRMKSWSITGYLLVLIYGVGTIVALVRQNELCIKICSWTVCLIIFIYWISYLIISKKN